MNSGSGCSKRRPNMGEKEERRRATCMRIYQVSQMTFRTKRRTPAYFPKTLLLQSKIFPSQSTPSFHASVRNHLLEEMRGLDPKALLVMKGLIKRGLYEKNDPDAVNLRESYGYVELFHYFFNVLQSLLILFSYIYSPG